MRLFVLPLACVQSPPAPCELAPVETMRVIACCADGDMDCSADTTPARCLLPLTGHAGAATPSKPVYRCQARVQHLHLRQALSPRLAV